MEYKALISAVPFRSLELILKKLDLTEADLSTLDLHRDIFVAKKSEFAEYFYASFLDVPETRIILERFGRPEDIKRMWATWFERLFKENLNKGFVRYLWKIGIKHVEINLDQRFSNLGFSLVRMFCHRTALEALDPGEAARVLPVIDKLIDFCILVETNAYIEATVRCDVEILRGIADKIRNPITIIGGNLRRFGRREDVSAPLKKDFEFLISYTSRCEDMIEDIGTYMELFEREAGLEKCMVETVIENMVEKLRDKKKLEGVSVDMSFSPEARLVLGDPIDLRHLFYHIIENAAEASRAAASPLVRVSSAPSETPPHTVRIEVFNNGEVINLENMEKILSPFYSTRSEGSGLGLSIAKLALKKSFGEISFEPLPGEGTKVIITLQKA